MKIVFLVRSLNFGGTERQVVLLAKGLQEKGHSIIVAVFYAAGGLEKKLYQAGVQVKILDKGGRWDVVTFLLRLLAFLRRERPDLVYSFLAIPNIFSLLVTSFFPSIRAVWGLRASNMNLDYYDCLIGFSYWLERQLSPFPQRIIANSWAGQTFSGKKGFSLERMIVIPNGIDTELFTPDSSAGKRLRVLLGIPDSAVLIGLVGRLDPMKDHHTFLQAATLFAQNRKDVRYVCIGDGPQAYRLQLHALSRELGLEDRVMWVGAREDMTVVYNAMDIATSSSSFGEGFSNVIGEAMACGVPCVVTDVGDSSRIVGDTGEIVPACDPQALVDGWGRMLRRLEVRPALRREVRNRIIEHFGLDSLLDKTTAALKNLCQTSH